MNKIVKIMATLLIAIILVATLSQTCLAAGQAIDAFDKGSGYDSQDLGGVKNIAQKVLTAIRNISIIVAVIMISILGIQYMVGSAEQAGYKKAFIPMIVGAILVVSAAQIAKMLFSLNG